MHYWRDLHHTWTTAATAHPHTLTYTQAKQSADIRISSGRGVLIPISSLLFHTVGDGACYSEHGESLRSTALWLPPCNQPLWLFRTHRALIATFIWRYSHSVRCCRGAFVLDTRGTRYKMTWLEGWCHAVTESYIAIMILAEKGLDPEK